MHMRILMMLHQQSTATRYLKLEKETEYTYTYILIEVWIFGKKLNLPLDYF